MNLVTHNLSLKVLALVLAIVIYHALKSNPPNYNLNAVNDRQQVNR